MQVIFEKMLKNTKFFQEIFRKIWKRVEKILEKLR